MGLDWLLLSFDECAILLLIKPNGYELNMFCFTIMLKMGVWETPPVAEFRRLFLPNSEIFKFFSVHSDIKFNGPLEWKCC